MQERFNSIANARELHLSCTNPSILPAVVPALLGARPSAATVIAMLGVYAQDSPSVHLLKLAVLP